MSYETIRECLKTVSPYTLEAALLVAIVVALIAIFKGIRVKSFDKNAPGGPGVWGWVAVVVLWAVVMLNYFDRQLLSVLHDPIVKGEDGIKMTDAEFGFLTSAFLVVYAVLSPLGGYLADRFSRKFIIMSSLVVWSVVTWLTGAAETYNQLLAARAAMGISEAFYIPAALALITDYHRGNTRSLATGLHMSGIYTGQIIAGFGATMATGKLALGWRLTFEAFGFFGVIYALIVILFLHDPQGAAAPAAPAEEAPKAEDKPAAEPTAAQENSFSFMEVMRSLFSRRAMCLLLIIVAIAGFANWFLMTWYPTLLGETFNLKPEEAGPKATVWVNVAKYVAVLGGAVIADLWYQRNRNARAYVPGISFLVAGPCIVLGMLGCSWLGLAAAIALISMQGVAQGALDATLMPLLRSNIDERFSATGYGMLNLTSAGIGALIAWGGGYLKDAGIPLTFSLTVAGALMCVCGLIFFFLGKPTDKTTA